jgi:hypothetical protein
VGRIAHKSIGLTSGMSCRALAERFGYSPDSVERHSANHLLPQMRAAILAGWQADLLRSQPCRAILNCSRQFEKSTTVAGGS